MTLLTVEETQQLGVGEFIATPIQFNDVDGGFCYHLCHWYLTGEIINLPAWPNVSDIEPYLKKILRLTKTFHTSNLETARSVETLTNLSPGDWLIRLWDTTTTDKGHWIVLKNDRVFEPGLKEMFPLSCWCSAFLNRQRVIRIYAIKR